MDVAVIGLGFVGLTTAALLAEDGHSVHGVDIDQDKVRRVSSGRVPLRPIPEGLAEIVREQVIDALRLQATTVHAKAIAGADAALVCVGTPAKGSGAVDLRFVRQAGNQLGAALSGRGRRLPVILRSTVPPGTTRGAFRQALEGAGASYGRDFTLGYNPEFLRERYAVQDMRSPPFVVAAADSAATAEALLALYPEQAIRFTTFPTAELVKYALNSFHALKVAFANEMWRIAEASGADGHAVMGAVADDPLSTSSYYLRPGQAFDGHCLPKDAAGLRELASEAGVSAHLAEAALRSNEAHRQWVSAGGGERHVLEQQR
jgi:GDP-mannose 6-dehydrogenase